MKVMAGTGLKMTGLRKGTLVNTTSNCIEGLRGKLWRSERYRERGKAWSDLVLPVAARC